LVKPGQPLQDKDMRQKQAAIEVNEQGKMQVLMMDGIIFWVNIGTRKRFVLACMIS